MLKCEYLHLKKPSHSDATDLRSEKASEFVAPSDSRHENRIEMGLVMAVSFWSADAPGHEGRPELFIKPTPGLSAMSQLRWRARCSCDWVGPTEYLGTASQSICPPATSAVTRAEWEVHRVEIDAINVDLTGENRPCCSGSVPGSRPQPF